jgi:hypothetical protein
MFALSPLSGAKRTSRFDRIMSACDPKRTSAGRALYLQIKPAKTPLDALKKSVPPLTRLQNITADKGKRMGSPSCRLAILSFAVSMLAIGLECASAEECDYKTCGALMARDGSVSWGVLGRRDYSPNTKQACAELNACLRRAKNNSAGRAAAAPAAGSSSLKSSSKGSATVLKPEPADKQTKGVQPASTSAVHQSSSNGIPNADRSDGKSPPCFAVAEILVPVDCSPSGPPYTQ